jgi:pyrimidine-nucleoside phosphorylase
LIGIARKFNRKAIALITDMNEPLGEAVGNSLEMIEAIEALKGKAPADLMEVTLALGVQMLHLGKKAKNPKEAEEKLRRSINTGQALAKFKEAIQRQGGNPSVLVDYRLLPTAKHRITVKSDREGYVQSMDTMRIGLSAVKLGAGRARMDSQIDPGVGFLIKKKTGDFVKKNEVLAAIWTNDLSKGKLASREIISSYRIENQKAVKLKKILRRVNP